MPRNQFVTRNLFEKNNIQQYMYNNSDGSNEDEETGNNVQNLLDDDEFSIFIKELKDIDMCNLFVDHIKSFGFGDYMYRLMKILNIDSYKNESLKKIVCQLKPKGDSKNISDEEFLYRLLDFTILIVNEPKLNEASIEILLLFNLLNSPQGLIKRDDTNDSDSPALIGSNNVQKYSFPSRLRYFVSLNILDVYEFSCKPDILLKRIRHPSYQEKCKNSTISKYVTDFFLNSLNVIQHSIRDDKDIHDEIMKQYKCFLKDNGVLIENNIKNSRQKIIQDISTVQSYPSLRQSLIEEILNNICKMSLSIERYVATRTSGSMENENYQYPCFLHFIT